ncbi:hypothetical protein AB0I95_11235 [Micromonospora sp. NPDC049751]|uniref:hypothetical protein n=1 Tax=Micromonospora sp. NPDC049751 TaxID=3154837 RepID=UPI0033ECA03E
MLSLGVDVVLCAASLQEPGQAGQPGTDVALLAAGYASVTVIRPVTEVTDVHLTGLDAQA